MCTNKYFIALDLDGTLLRSDKTISDKTKQYLKNLSSKGNFISIASGRPINYVKGLYKDLGFQGPFVAYNGGYIEIPSLNFCETIVINKDYIKEFYKENIGHTIDSLMCETINSAYVDKEDTLLERFFSHEGLKKHKGDISKILNDDCMCCVFKIAQPIETNKTKIFEYFNKNPNYKFRFWSTFDYGEIIIPDVTKGTKLKKIVEICGVLDAKTLVFGDAINDKEMLENFTNSFVMINGEPAMKSIAKYITKKDNDHDGVISSIDDFINNRI